MQDHTPTPTFPTNLEDYAPWVSKHGLIAPYGECQCGCGQSAPVSPRTYNKTGVIAGHPRRFIVGHNRAIQTQMHREKEFWRKVEQRTENECWLWKGRLKPNGYGAFGERLGTSLLAHRFSWEIHFGPIPDGMFVCHRCDNPPCVNPNHLFLGTPMDNMQDKIAKGRSMVLRGDDAPGAKLTTSQVTHIRKLAAEGISSLVIADTFSVSARVVYRILRGETWRHLIE